MQKKTLSVLIALALSATSLGAAAAPPQTPADNAAAAQAASPQISYLGVGLSPIPEAVGANLLANVPAGQGIMITEVEPGSPAAKAGLSAYDILLRYGDQKLYSPRQLTSLVQADAPGTKVELEYVHQGEIAKLDVTLGEHAAPSRAMAPGMVDMPMPPWFPHGPSGQPGFPHWGPMMHAMPGQPNGPQAGPAPGQGMAPPGNSPGNAMEQFDSLAISQTNGKYKIEMAYLDEKGVERKFRYEGTADEVRKVIEDDKTLPDDKRGQLLQALRMNGPGAIPGAMPGNMPDIRSLMQQMGMGQGFNPWGPPNVPNPW